MLALPKVTCHVCIYFFPCLITRVYDAIIPWNNLCCKTRNGFYSTGSLTTLLVAKEVKYVWPFLNIMHEKVKIRTAKSLVDTRWKFTEAVVQRCSVNKVFLKISQNSQNNTCARNVNKVAGLRPEFRVHKTFRACHESLLTTIYTLKLCPASRGLIDS